MAAGLVLRLINLGSCLSYDEIVTLVKYVRLPAGSCSSDVHRVQQPHALQPRGAGVDRGFGESAWALRLPAVLFGVATIPAVLVARLAGARPP